MGIPRIAGRDFENESATSLRTAVVNEQFVQRLLGNENPIGQRVRDGGPRVRNHRRRQEYEVARTQNALICINMSLRGNRAPARRDFMQPWMVAKNAV
jgi:hypothetical protein